MGSVSRSLDHNSFLLQVKKCKQVWTLKGKFIIKGNVNVFARRGRDKSNFHS